MTDKLPQTTKTSIRENLMRPSALGTRRNRSKKIFKLATIIAILIATVTIGGRLFSSHSSRSPSSRTLGQTSKSVQLDQELNIPILDSNGDESDKSITYELLSAELTNEIILKGQKATAVGDRIFLIINIKLSNPGEDGVKVDTRNYIRLSVNDQEDRLAPNVHNDPVEVQPISDQPSRLGFSINSQDQNHILYLGEISGKKTEIPLNFD